MNHILSCIASIHMRYRALVAIRDGYCKTKRPDSSIDDLASLEVWIKEKVEAILDTEEPFTDENTKTLLAMHQVYGDDLLFRKYVPFANPFRCNLVTSAQNITLLEETNYHFHNLFPCRPIRSMQARRSF